MSNFCCCSLPLSFSPGEVIVTARGQRLPKLLTRPTFLTRAACCHCQPVRVSNLGFMRKEVCKIEHQPEKETELVVEPKNQIQMLKWTSSHVHKWFLAKHIKCMQFFAIYIFFVRLLLTNAFQICSKPQSCELSSACVYMCMFVFRGTIFFSNSKITLRQSVITCFIEHK